MKTTTYEELVASVEEFNRKSGPKLGLFIQSYYDNDFDVVYTGKERNRIKLQFQVMIEDWQTDFETVEEVNEFLLHWEKIKEIDWI